MEEAPPNALGVVVAPKEVPAPKPPNVGFGAPNMIARATQAPNEDPPISELRELRRFRWKVSLSAQHEKQRRASYSLASCNNDESAATVFSLYLYVSDYATIANFLKPMPCQLRAAKSSFGF